MSGQPWGRTGRVTLNPLYPGVLTEVCVDDELVGHVYDDDLYAWDRHRWKFSPPMPTADHALWWLLRRAAPDVWRAERPVVWRVLRGEESFPIQRWHVHGQSHEGHRFGCTSEHYDSNSGWRQSVDEAFFRAHYEHEQATR